MRRLALAAAACLAASAAGAAPALELRAPEALAWRGVPAAPADGTTAQFLYPAPSLLGGLVAVLTHGAIVSGGRAAEEKKRQEEADKVLESFQPALSEWSANALAEAALAHLGGAGGGRGWVVESKPAFSLYPDRTRLFVDTTVRVLDPAQATPPLELTVRVLSAARSEPFPADDQAAALKDASVRLYAHALAVALHAAANPRLAAPSDEIPFRTHRFADGEREGMERAQLVGRGCGRLVLRNLRGHWLSVPIRGEAAPGCDDPYRFPVADAPALATAIAPPASSAGNGPAR
jgi:hypothetical protein